MRNTSQNTPVKLEQVAIRQLKAHRRACCYVTQTQMKEEEKSTQYDKQLVKNIIALVTVLSSVYFCVRITPCEFLF